MYIPTKAMARAREAGVGRSQKLLPAPGLQVGRVAAIHPDTYTVDVRLGTGDMLWNVRVSSDIAGTRAGHSYLQAVSSVAQEQTSMGPIDTFHNDARRSVYALIGFVQDDPSHPVVLGFLFSRLGQMTWATPGMRIERHESDIYTMTRNGAPTSYDAATDTTLGEWETVFSDGSYARVGAGTAHADLTGQDAAGLWRVRGSANASAAPGVAGPRGADRQDALFKHSSGTTVAIDPAGNLSITLGPGAAYRLAGIATTTSAPGAGGAGALPATPAGYVSVTVNGAVRKLPYY